jgi:DNA-binding NarL/FixJ family response regulator
MNRTPGSGGQAIRLMLVDDHELFLAGLRLLLRAEPDLEVVGEAHNCIEALDVARERPDVILLDLMLGAENALDFLPDLLEAAGGARVLVLTAIPDHETCVRAVSLGAVGVMDKVEAPDALLKAIRKVHLGEAWLNRSMVARAMMQLQARRTGKLDPDAAKIASLTARELEVIAAIGEGFRNKQIGKRLFISEKTVRHYLTSIFEKLDVGDRFALMIYAYQQGLAKVPKPCSQDEIRGGRSVAPIWRRAAGDRIGTT